MILPSCRLAVVLMNLGGPDTLSSVKPFLKNLFSDQAIIKAPWPIRPILAQLISTIRARKLKTICKKMGGGSPILKNTQSQQACLVDWLRKQLPSCEIEVFIAMRYWNPLIAKAVSEVKSFQPTQIVLLPLYPQFSITTTGSSFKEWSKQAELQGLRTPTWQINSYPTNEAFINAHVSLITPLIEKAVAYGQPRLLFSAHGLPRKVIDQGDPYEMHVHQTVYAIRKKLPSTLESVICYQSKVGPQKWLEPSIQEEIKRAGRDKVPVIVNPVSFVSEHSETLVELDEDYRDLARTQNVPFYGRVPALGSHPAYIQALGGLVVSSISNHQNHTIFSCA